MIGSLSSDSRIWPSAIQHQQRLGQPIDKSIPESGINQDLNLQKFPNPGISRPTSMPSPNASMSALPNPGISRPTSMPSPNASMSALQSAQSLQQQWMPSQGKQTHGPPLSSSSFRAQTKQHISQQRPQSSQQQQQQQKHSPTLIPNQLQVSSSQQQQQQQQKQLQQHQQPQLVEQQNIFIPHHFQDHSNRNQQALPQQNFQATRGHTSIPQRIHNQLGQPFLPGITIPLTDVPTEIGNQILSRRSIQELVAQIDPYEKLEPEVEDVLVEIADDFIESITTAACSLAKHRKSNTLEAKDVLLHVEKNWNITLPGFAGDEVKLYKKPCTNDIHKERLAMVRKSMGAASDLGSTKNVGAGR